MRRIAIIQARIGSKRLPGKVLLPLPSGRTVLAEVIHRVKQIRGLDAIIVAIPDTAHDGLLIPHISRAGVAYYTGPHEDVLARYWQAARAVKADVIVRITADCPLIDPEICEAVLGDIDVAQDGKTPDYVCNFMPRTFPKGWDCEAFTWDILDFAHRNAVRAYDREHVTSFMYSSWFRPDVNVRSVVNRDGENWSNYDFALDEIDDYYRICVEMQNRMDRAQQKRRAVQ